MERSSDCDLLLFSKQLSKKSKSRSNVLEGRLGSTSPSLPVHAISSSCSLSSTESCVNVYSLSTKWWYHSPSNLGTASTQRRIPGLTCDAISANDTDDSGDGNEDFSALACSWLGSLEEANEVLVDLLDVLRNEEKDVLAAVEVEDDVEKRVLLLLTKDLALSKVEALDTRWGGFLTVLRSMGCRLRSSRVVACRVAMKPSPSMMKEKRPKQM